MRYIQTIRYLALLWVCVPMLMAFPTQKARENQDQVHSSNTIVMYTQSNPQQQGTKQSSLVNSVKNEVIQHKGLTSIPNIIVANIEIYEDWAFGTIAIPAPREIHVAPESMLFLAKANNSHWDVVLESMATFTQWAQQSPEELMGANTKKLLSQQVLLRAPQGNGSAQLSLPWATGETWTFSGGPHNDPRPWDAVDFAGGSGNVRAARDGTAFTPCANLIRIIHESGGWTTTYYHLVNIAIGNNVQVTRGQYLGDTSAEYNCGGYADGTHVHFGLEYNGVAQDINDHDIGGWTVQEGATPYAGCMYHSATNNTRCKPGQIYNYGTVGSGTCCGCVSAFAYSQDHILQPNFMDQFAADGPAYTAVPDPQNNTTAPEAWPTLSLPTQAPAFVQNGWDAAWANKSTLTVNWSLANTDTLTGYQLFWDQSATTTSSEKPLMLSAKATGAEIPVAASGVWYVHLRAMSKDGGVSETVHAGPFNIDLTPPQMVSASLPETSWVSNPQPPTFHWPAASDEASGLGGYRVYWGDDANGQSDALVTETSYTPSETMASSSSAVRYLRVAAEDAVGNVGEWQTVAVWRYDNLPPTGTLAVGSGGEEVRSLNVTLNISGSDQQGAITDMRFSSNGTLWSAWQPYQTTQFWQLANTPEKQAVYMQLRDGAGNVSKPITAEVVAVLNADNPTSSSYELASSTFGMGGGTKSSASYTVNGTSGQTHETGSASSPSYQVNSGYWVDPDTGCTAVSAAAPLIETTVSNQVKLSWASVPNATSYNIYRSTNAPYFTPSTLYDTANTSPWYDDGAIGTPSSNYFYIIRAVGSCGESVNSQRLGKFDFAIQPGSP